VENITAVFEADSALGQVALASAFAVLGLVCVRLGRWIGGKSTKLYKRAPETTAQEEDETDRTNRLHGRQQEAESTSYPFRFLATSAVTVAIVSFLLAALLVSVALWNAAETIWDNLEQASG
jgi:predicted DNA binding CopG/RHH family protein